MATPQKGLYIEKTQMSWREGGIYIRCNREKERPRRDDTQRMQWDVCTHAQKESASSTVGCGARCGGNKSDHRGNTRFMPWLFVAFMSADWQCVCNAV